ncbi:MAG: hypothetical protein EXS38_07800 [Opitutus sp.]|nr:hypothetical protein [Opitutus sp.]
MSPTALRRIISSIGVALLLLHGLRAQPMPVDPGWMVFPNGDEPITLFTYKPPTYRDGALLVVFHGVERNAEGYRNYAITMAERFGVIVEAPLFDRERFPLVRYQSGGILAQDGKLQPAEKWTYALVPKMAAHLRRLEGRPELPYYLIGHSAGGQFLMRLAAFLPGEAVRIVSGNPGTSLFPTRDQEFRYGFGGLPADLSNDEVLKRYLAAPLTFYLGTGDILPNHSLDLSAVGLRQGPNRLVRGRACFGAAQQLAQARGWPFNWRKVETPDIGHEAAFMFAAQEVADALFGK